MSPIAQFIVQALPAPQLPQLPDGPDLTRIREPIAEASQIDPGILIFGIASIILLVALFIWLYRRAGSKDAPPSSPECAALAEIKTAADMAKDDLAFATLSSTALRRFLIARFQISSGESNTSTEFIRRLPIEDSNQSLVRSFLETCDSVKFANQALTDAERENIRKTAEQLINELKGTAAES